MLGGLLKGMLMNAERSKATPEEENVSLSLSLSRARVKTKKKRGFPRAVDWTSVDGSPCVKVVAFLLGETQRDFWV